MRNIAALTEHNVDLISRIEKTALNKRTSGEWVADVVTAWIGSWTFLIASVLLLIWIALNLFGWWCTGPLSFILLNLGSRFRRPTPHRSV